MVTIEEVEKVLRTCYDPEIPINVVDLGLIYDVKVEGEKVHVKMTLTAPGCPMHSFISQDVKRKLEATKGVKEALVEVVWDPPWTPKKMEEAAQRKMPWLQRE